MKFEVTNCVKIFVEKIRSFQKKVRLRLKANCNRKEAYSSIISHLVDTMIAKDRRGLQKNDLLILKGQLNEIAEALSRINTILSKYHLITVMISRSKQNPSYLEGLRTSL
jgi:signal transduction histidine kinase